MKRILVVDDSQTILRQACGVLEGAGHEVATAKDGFEAIAKIADFQPDLLFVDILMPRIDGYQTCSLVKNSRHHGGVPVVMVSSESGPFDRARGQIVGADGHIGKPVGETELLDAVEQYAETADAG